MKCGIDMVSIPRIAKLVQRRGAGGLDAIWTQAEILDCKKKDGTLNMASLAARYAAKEAVAKAFGTGFLRSGIRPCDIEIRKHPSGEPFVILHGASKTLYESRAEFTGSGERRLIVSLSHDADMATAMCIIS